MKIAICDDQTAHLEILKPYVQEFFTGKGISAEISEIADGADVLEGDKFDIIFLDIELGDMSGIDVIKSLKQRKSRAVIIVVTAYNEYLDDAMDLDVIRFLKKPVAQSKVFSALERALQDINENQITFTTKDKKLIRVKSREIVYAEARLKNVIVHTVSESYTVREPLKAIRSALTSTDFAVPHNSYVVNMNYISKFSREEIILDVRDRKVPVHIANKKQPEFKRRFLAFIGEGE